MCLIYARKTSHTHQSSCQTMCVQTSQTPPQHPKQTALLTAAQSSHAEMLQPATCPQEAGMDGNTNLIGCNSSTLTPFTASDPPLMYALSCTFPLPAQCWCIARKGCCHCGSLHPGSQMCSVWLKAPSALKRHPITQTACRRGSPSQSVGCMG